MRPRHDTAAVFALLVTLAPMPAGAYTFNLVSDPGGQHLNWLWEWCTSSCTTSGTCGSFSSVDGNIAYSSNGSGSNLTGGLLSWNASSGSLSILAMPTVAAYAPLQFSCSGRWAAIDARDVPLRFSITPEAGDPFPFNATLHIQPRLTGTIEHFTSAGTQANLWLQMMATVSVDDQVVSADSLYTFLQLTDGADSLWQLKFPKGGANSVLIPNVTAGSEVLVRIWAYMRGYVTTPSQANTLIYSYSAFGQGPAIEVLVRDQNAVDVPSPPDPGTLSLMARPNPSPGSTRIRYTLPRPSQVRLSVFDLRGARVATLVDRFESAGRGEVEWNGRDARGGRLAPGVYVVQLDAGAERSTSRLVLLGR